MPKWAVSTLERHKGDARDHIKSQKQLDQGTTGDAFWDAAQQQLANTGAPVVLPYVCAAGFWRLCGVQHC